MRYFIELSYNGTRYHGYQRQPNATSIQSVLEEALATLLRQATPIVGCGRTDAGVHALQYYIHFDTPKALPDSFLYQLNSLIGNDIVCYQILSVSDTAHARFDATSRSYQYCIDLERNPFHQETAFYCRYGRTLDLEKMQAAAALLLNYKDFTTFCKSKTDTKTNLCDLRRSEWVLSADKKQLTYYVTANRFLRGMIRLIVGMCLNVGRGKIDLATVQAALEAKTPMRQALSAPPQGLYLMDIKYDFIG